MSINARRRDESKKNEKLMIVRLIEDVLYKTRRILETSKFFIILISF